MNSFLCSQGPMALKNYMETHLKQTKPDITLQSEEKIEIMVHKEIFYQTQLMRTMIRSTDSDYCCSNVSLICSIPREELEMMVQFLYSGEVYCKNQKEANILSENLTELFGFPKIHSSSNIIEPKFEITSNMISKEGLTSNLTKSNQRKKSRKQSLTSDSIRNEFIDNLVSIKIDSKDLFNETNMNEENLSDPLDTNEKGEDAERDTICKVACTICSKFFVSKQALAAHVFAGKHSDTCNVCLKQFESKQHLEDHITTAHTLPDFRKRLRCVICNIYFKRKNKDKSTLVKHMKSEHNVGYKCPICQMQQPSLSTLNQHKIQEHNSAVKIKYLCPKCGKEFIHKRKYEQHVSKISCNYTGRKCPICEEKIESMSLKIDHIATKHKDIKLYDCSECSSRFITQNGLKRHISFVHRKNVGNICPTCGKTYRSISVLKDHISYMHEGKVKPKLKCSLCEESYSHSIFGKQALENHMSVHEGKIFQCSNCNMEFNSKNKLEAHIAKEHDRSKLHKCAHCDSGYLTKTALLSHIAFVHEKTIGNICPHCGRNCINKGVLKQHVRNVHELAGTKPYKCGDCEKHFKTEGEKKTHIKIIHEGKFTVNCPICQKSFPTYEESHLSHWYGFGKCSLTTCLSNIILELNSSLQFVH